MNDRGRPATEGARQALEQQSLAQLLETVERSRRERVAAIEERANAERTALVREARKRALQRVTEAARGIRRAHAEQLEHAKASLATRLRERRHAALRELVEQSWHALPAVLAAEWRDRARRARWIADALSLAARKLPRQRWTVIHPASLEADELDELIARAQAATGEAPSLEGSSDLEAGLVVRASSATLDASPAGLLRDRARITGRLLGEWLAEAR